MRRFDLAGDVEQTVAGEIEQSGVHVVQGDRETLAPDLRERRVVDQGLCDGPCLRQAGPDLGDAQASEES